MAEIRLDLRNAPKDRAYAELHAHIISVLGDIDDEIAGMATVSAMIHDSFRHLWTGFYRVVSPSLLRVGPYQGTLGCLEIAMGRGVCGTAAAERRTVIVPDVRKFPGHIACDERSRSEIVVPVLNAAGALIAVLDIDSERTATFDEQDRVGLENIVTWFSGVGRSVAR
jgi:L-methionine (R)-S-oxide reductase